MKPFGSRSLFFKASVIIFIIVVFILIFVVYVEFSEKIGIILISLFGGFFGYLRNKGI